MSEKFSKPIDKVCYHIGRQLGDQLANNPFEEVNIEALQEGLADSVNKVESQISQEQIEAAFNEVNQGLEAQAKTDHKEVIEKGEVYLTENATREEITVTDSGLQYEVITMGDGPIPASTNTIKAHYKGTLIDGTPFDSSYDRGQPAEFPVSGVIKGWVEALQIMPVGSKWKLHIPQELAYGLQGAGSDIPPGAALVFDIELLEITG